MKKTIENELSGVNSVITMEKILSTTERSQLKSTTDSLIELMKSTKSVQDTRTAKQTELFKRILLSQSTLEGKFGVELDEFVDRKLQKVRE